MLEIARGAIYGLGTISGFSKLVYKHPAFLRTPELGFGREADVFLHQLVLFIEGNMERDPVLLGSASAIAAYVFAKFLDIALAFFVAGPLTGPFPNLIAQAIDSLPWLVGGFVARVFFN